MNTIAATTRRVPRPALIGIVVARRRLRGPHGRARRRARRLVGRIDSPSPHRRRRTPVTPAKPRTAPAKPRRSSCSPASPRRSLPGFATRRSSSSPSTSARRRAIAQAVAAARAGARTAGAGFVAVNVGNDKTAGAIAPSSGPSDLTVHARRPPSRQDRDPDLGHGRERRRRAGRAQRRRTSLSTDLWRNPGGIGCCRFRPLPVPARGSPRRPRRCDAPR